MYSSFQDYLRCLESGGCGADVITVTGQAYNPLTGVAGLQDLLGGRDFLNALAATPGTGVGPLREYYERRFEQMAVQGNYVAAAIDFVGLQIALPESNGDLGMEVAMSFLPLGRVLNVAGGTATVRQVLKGADRWLGKGYKEIASGVFRSADGRRQFRMRTSDLLDPRQGPHVHFESIGLDGRTRLENSHVLLSDP
jgi:hypothetical protein